MNTFSTTAGSCLLLLCVTFSSGCVTESSGGIPGPAPAEARVQAQLGLARGYLEQRDFNRARGPLARALKIDSEHAEAHVLSAVLMNLEGEYELAEEHYQRALKKEPRNAQALNNYGSFLYSRGRFEDALVPLSKLVEDTSYRARSQAFESLGLAQLQAGQRDEARSSFHRALDLNARQPRSALELAELSYQDGAIGIANRRYNEFKSMARQNSRSLCLGVKLAIASDDNDQVASYSMALKNLYPKQASACLAKK